MTLDEVLKKLEALGDEKVRAQNAKRGAGKNQFGVKLGDIRKIAKPIKTDHKLALALWKTGNIDARLLATLIIDVNALSAKDLDRMVRSVDYAGLADWLYSYVIKAHPEKDALREQWMTDDHPMAARAGWQLTAGRVIKDPKGLDLPALLDRIEAEMPGAAPETQWTMNTTLGEIGINHARHRKRAVAIGEKIGLYQDWPVSKGCTPPYVPVWVAEMVKRQG